MCGGSLPEVHAARAQNCLAGRSLPPDAGERGDGAQQRDSGARRSAIGARIVSGCLFDPDERMLGSMYEGSTHAWAEVYVPGAGWITFDPTNRGVGGSNAIPDAVARDIWPAMPATERFTRMSDTFLGMSVQVFVTPHNTAA
jgi:hypothetical protein